MHKRLPTDLTGGSVRPHAADDVLSVGRFEQCLSADVLADTFPNKRLPSTGGPSLLLMPWLVALLAAAIQVLIVSVGGAARQAGGTPPGQWRGSNGQRAAVYGEGAEAPGVLVKVVWWVTPSNEKGGF